jgi:LysM repeat protein
VVALPAGSWRQFAAPVAFLAAVTLAVVGARVLWPHRAASVERPHQPKVATAPAPRYYRVKPGDTLAEIAARTKTPVARLHRLNPHVQPTALFIGQRLRLR